MEMIRFNDVSMRFANGYQALYDINFTIEKNEMVFLTGHSGAGKSTILKLILLSERATRGQIWMHGRNLRTVTSKRACYYRRNIGTVFQNNQLLFDRNVYDNIALPLIIAGYPQTQIARRVEAVLERVALDDYATRNPMKLSAGEQQRVGIARAIVNNPLLLIADEPTGNLDPDLSDSIMNLFAHLHDSGTTILIVSHDLSLVQKMQHRVITLKNGRLTGDTLR